MLKCIPRRTKRSFARLLLRTRHGHKPQLGEKQNESPKFKLKLKLKRKRSSKLFCWGCRTLSVVGLKGVRNPRVLQRLQQLQAASLSPPQSLQQARLTSEVLAAIALPKGRGGAALAEAAV
jgi:cytoskeletal protein RodZ